MRVRGVEIPQNWMDPYILLEEVGNAALDKE